MTGSTIYNTTDGPLIIDRAGRVLGGRERLEDVDVDASPVAGHIAAGRLVVLDDAPMTNEPATAEDAPATSSSRKGRRSSTTTTEEG